MAWSPRRAVLESLVIITSILLAFGVDAWWEERREAADTRESLEVVRRDLVDMLTQLEEFEQLANATARASFEAIRPLTGPDPVPEADRPQIEQYLLRAGSRRTMRLPRAGYTDLLSTGTLQEIDNRALRDQLVQFYEAADRAQEIIEKNTSRFTDQLLKGAMYGNGLLIPIHIIDDRDLYLSDVRNQMTEELTGPDFPRRQARHWRLPPDAPEIDQLLAALAQNARGAIGNEIMAGITRDAAEQLLQRLDDHLAER